MSKKIKMVRRYHRDYKNFSYTEMAPTADEEYLELVVEMDENGNPISESKFDQDGELEEKNTFVYDKNGKVIEHQLLYAVDDMTERRVMNRDEKGHLLSEVKYYGDEPGEKEEYTYDSAMNIIGIKKYDEEGEFLENEEMKYDANKSLTERIAFNSAGKMIRKVSYDLSEKKTAVETEFDENGKVTSKTEIFFNDQGKEEKLIQTDVKGNLIAATYNFYDDRGNVIKRQHKDFYSKTITYSYDEQNRLINQEMYDANGLLLRKNIYEYDEDGNLTAEQTYEIDTTRGGRDKHFGTRYEYEFVA